MPHIVSAFDDDLIAIQARITEMGGLAEDLLARALDAVEKHDSALARQVIEDDKKLDALEFEVEDMAMRVIALRQPMAQDLRVLISALKICTTLERIGDYAKNIAKRSLVLNQLPPTGPLNSIYNLSRMVQVMLHEVLDAYAAGNASVAEQLRQRDEEVDAAHTGVFRELITYMMEDPRTITASTHLAFIAKNLERVGDHATNIAESVVFQVSGERLVERHLADETADD